MANPTTNFGWVMPTSSSLVTNLPADFNTFGQAVDTSMSELLGGTTGQVLSKTSNTNMDFTWVTPTDQTPLTTKGDLFTFTTVDARLGVGANGTVLTADSAESSGLKWATPASGSTFVGCSLSKNASQSIANGAYTALTFQVELFDTDGFHSTSTNTERITIPAGKGGYYLIIGQVSMTGTATLTNVRRVPEITKNGTTTLKNQDAPIGQDYPNGIVMTIANLVATDYITLRVYNGQGSSLPINDGVEATQFAAYYLGA